MTTADSPIDRLLRVMAQLRDRQSGCPWDIEQTFATIAPYTIEEAYEVADAIERADMPGLREELGDLLFQVVFHARLAAERGWFTFDDVAESIATKLTVRHPHVFAGAHFADAAEQTDAWEAMKAREREANGERGTLADVPLAMPALMRAAKLGRRAARVGFDWPDAAGTRQKVAEELRELDATVRDGDAARQSEELGDLLFAVAQWARHLGLEPEAALRDANRKFEARFRHMESLAAASGRSLGELDYAAWDRLWIAAKAAARGT